MLTLGGIIPIRDGNRLDFCWRECVKSLLPVCEMVVLADGGSTDGTQDEIREWAKTEPKIRLAVWKWPDPHNNEKFFLDWLQFAREQCQTDSIFELDADEVLAEWSYPEIELYKLRDPEPPFSLNCHRYNFWLDAQHTIPHGHCLSDNPVRFGPQRMFMPSDGFDPRGCEICDVASQSGIEIFHYGFIRKPEAFFEKERLLQKWWAGGFDPRLERAHKQSLETGRSWMEFNEQAWKDIPPTDYPGPHPKVIHDWLMARGHYPGWYSEFAA